MNPVYWKKLAAVCRIILGATFVFSGFSKVVDPWGTALKVNEYLSIYGFEWLERYSMGFSIWLCGAELMMGCMLLCKVRIRLVSIFAFASMIFFTLLTFLSATWIPVEDCGCFGEAFKLTPWQTFFKNLVLLPLSWVVWRRYRPDRIFAFTRAEVLLTCFFFALSMGLGIYCYRHLPLVDFLPYKVGLDLRQARLNPHPEATEEVHTLLIYRNRQTGRLHEFTLEETEWQDDTKWEWVETRTDYDTPSVRPLIGEFSLRDAAGDATEEILSCPGRVYLLCAATPSHLPRRCAERFRRIAERAAAEQARVVCLTPEPLHGSVRIPFDGGVGVRCYNIDATTLKTMLRADAGMVVLEDGVIVDKKNCRDIE